jgi:hypothetical protein
MRVFPVHVWPHGLKGLTRQLKTLRRHAAKLKRPRLPPHITELDLDEMWSFVGSKEQQAWLWHAFEPRSPRIVAWTVGERTDQTCRRLLRQLRGFVRSYASVRMSGSLIRS